MSAVMGNKWLACRPASCWLACITALVLTGCSGDGYDDLRKFMKDTDAALPRHIDPLPQAAAYEPFTYDSAGLADPFRPRSLRSDTSQASGANAPDTTRPREALERFPLDSLKMVGVLQQKGQTYALIRAESTLYRVKAGDHMGLDFGVVTAISEGEVALRENVQDAGGEWTLRQARLTLADAQENRK